MLLSQARLIWRHCELLMYSICPVVLFLVTEVDAKIPRYFNHFTPPAPLIFIQPVFFPKHLCSLRKCSLVQKITTVTSTNEA